jgi:two-component system OmpR family response regulator
MMRHPGQVLTRTMMMEAIWDYSFNPGTNVIDVHVGRLRAKIDGEGEPPMIRTVRGAGYSLDAV